MTIVYNKVIPFKGFKCVNLFGVLFVREGCVMSDTDYNHEAIHTAQMKSCFISDSIFCTWPNGCGILYDYEMQMPHTSPSVLSARLTTMKMIWNT